MTATQGAWDLLLPMLSADLQPVRAAHQGMGNDFRLREEKGEP
jgi:hypothetical protein